MNAATYPTTPPHLPEGPAAALIARYRMQRIPQEGAWFAPAHVSPDRVPASALPARYAGSEDRPLGSSILALVTRHDFSALHRLRTEETWHFYDGDPLELLLLHPDGQAELIILGRDSAAGQRPQVTVPPGVWMGARPTPTDPAAYSFFGCTLAPGFDYTDYEHGDRAALQAGWPAASALIAALTREPADAPGLADAALAPRPCVILSAATVFEQRPAPGLTLRELAGRAASHRETALSLTRFTLAPGASTGHSRYLGADEVFYILSGSGSVTLDDASSPVQAGDTVVVPRCMPHAIAAAADTPLEFLAIIAPAFDPALYQPH